MELTPKSFDFVENFIRRKVAYVVFGDFVIRIPDVGFESAGFDSQCDRH